METTTGLHMRRTFSNTEPRRVAVLAQSRLDPPFLSVGEAMFRRW
jgi:hypothetical protein